MPGATSTGNNVARVIRAISPEWCVHVFLHRRPGSPDRPPLADMAAVDAKRGSEVDEVPAAERARGVGPERVDRGSAWGRLQAAVATVREDDDGRHPRRPSR